MREDADAGVRRCVDLMTSGRWISGRSHADVAAEFGVTPASVKAWATNASRIIRIAIEGDREDIRARMLATLDTVVSMALSKETVVPQRDGDAIVVPQPDLKAAVMAVGEQGKLLGLVSQRVDVTTRQAVTNLTREEHLAELAKLQAEIAAETARIASGLS